MQIAGYSIVSGELISGIWIKQKIQRKKADIPYVAFDVAFGGKADMSLCTAHVRF
jgi:hypothetical protein